MTLTQSKPDTTVTRRLAGKVALVTGGSRGIGAAIALRLAEEGATVALSYSKSPDAAQKVVEAITKEGASAVALKADVADLSETTALVKEIEKQFGRIDILVNNAGVVGVGSIEDLDVEQ